MAIPKSREDRELDKFGDRNGKTGVRVFYADTDLPLPVSGSFSASTGGLLGGLAFDFIEVSYPNATTEIFTYKDGGNLGTTVAVITVAYTNSSKEYVSTVTKV